ncbi:MAG: hypothetical protein A2W91_07455 [Bacteroidetes bacterium GWF2_38_335]|nr:MAG: hypothetical protein A2W91_07455 [Bacteroidetes bacterium GWF2_38_335]OFY78560.1 MAG: hypothetical protein A2281_17745 [Bacteroidetes bacterium RIFOXYA12_FULL_38_20]HBS85056.1 peptidase M1 [Bacteroidales bacterium]
MKQVLLFFFGLISLAALAQVRDFQQGPDICSKSKIELFKSYKNTKNLKGAGGMYDLKYHRFEWNINPYIESIQGNVTSYFVPSSSLTEITFDLSDTLIVDSVKYHGILCANTLSADVLTITFPSLLPASVLDSVTVFYHGEPRENFRAFTQDWYNSHAIIWTLSEPYGAKEWWPCKQDLNDKIDSIDIFVTAHLRNKVGSNGIIVSETISDTLKTTHWKHRHPIAAYLVAIAVTDYVEYSDYCVLSEDDSIQILNYVFSEDSAEIATLTPITADCMEKFNSNFLMYPYKNEKYGHAQFTWPGGMEHQTMSFMGSFGYEIVSHELAHMWFGDYITCGSWHDIWVNESFATYLCGWGYQYFFGGIYWKLWLDINIERITEYPDGSVYCPDTTDVERVFSSRLSYRKGSALLHMLRWELGDSVWYLSMRNILSDPALANNYAMTEDIVGHFEAAGDTSLTEFFNDWFYGEGYPQYQIHWIQDESNHVTMTISQTQSHESVSFYEMHLPIMFYGEGTDSLVRIKHSFSGESFEINPGFSIDSVVLDPDLWLLTKDALIQKIEAPEQEENITIAPNPVRDFLEIKVKTPLEIKELSIFDSSGKIVFSTLAGNDKLKMKTDISLLPGGQYTAVITTNGGTYRKKIIKLKN